MILRTGVDLIEISRLQRAVERHGARFLNRVFTPQEIEDTHGRFDSLAARFAAKEATSKALGTGFGEIAWTDVEVVRGPDREPSLRLLGSAAKVAGQLRLSTWSVSLSHDGSYAIAFVVAIGI